MSYEVEKFNYRVEIIPLVSDYERDTKGITAEQRARQVAKYIERNVDNVASVEVIHDEVGRCSHCKSRWEDVSPYCCQAAREEEGIVF